MHLHDYSPFANLSPRACRAWGLLTGAIGFGASGVGAWFFYIGLSVLEANEASRWALMLAGGLLVSGQLAAFGVASWLPEAALRRLRWMLVALGLSLFAFEIASTAVTQLAMMDRAQADSAGGKSQRAELRQSIAGLRSTVAGLQVNAAEQSRSKIPASREAGAAALREALAVQAEISRKERELAALHEAARPTLLGLLGQEMATWLVVARSALLALVGLGMTTASGAMFRLARGAAHEVRADRAPPASGLPFRHERHRSGTRAAVPTAHNSSLAPLVVHSVAQAMPSVWSPLRLRASQADAHVAEPHDSGASRSASPEADPARPATVMPANTEPVSATYRLRVVAGTEAVSTTTSEPGQHTMAKAVVSAAAAAYAAIYLESVRLMVRNGAGLQRVDAYVAAALPAGEGADVLGCWIAAESCEGLWSVVFMDLRRLGVENVKLFVAEAFAGLDTAMSREFPNAHRVADVAHLMAASVEHLGRKERQPLLRELRAICLAATSDLAAAKLEDLEHGNLGRQYPRVIAQWRRAWPFVTPMFLSATQTRKAMLAPQGIEHVLAAMRHAVKVQGVPTTVDQACRALWAAMKHDHEAQQVAAAARRRGSGGMNP